MKTFITQPHCGLVLRWIVLASCLGLVPCVGWAQQPPASEPALPKIRPETPEFKQATDELREHLKNMRGVLVRFNTNLVESQDRELRAQWFELRRSGIPVFERFLQTALAEYQSDPAAKTAIAEMLWKIVNDNVEDDRYEGMLPVAQALLANNYPQEKLLSTASMIAFALCDFEALRPILNKLAIEGGASPQLMGLQQDLPRVEKLWQEELQARQQDAQGEPLPRVLMHTSKGDIEFELFENQAPETVANFISLIESGFYQGHTFHRVIEHFMAQTGCPTGDGTGGPGYTIYNENDKPGARGFFRGTLGLALSQDPNSGGSQFFVTFVPTYQLNDGFTAFGRVISGMDVLSNLVRINPDEKKEEGAPAAMPDEIVSMEVLFKRDHAYQPNKVK